MPIREELRHFYGKHWKTVVRPRILARAGDKCERCGAPNRKVVLRTFGWWAEGNLEATVFKMGGRLKGKEITQLVWHHAGMEPKLLGFPLMESMHWVGIVLTVAHLNHVAGDDRDENLQAMCQWCHLDYDARFHKHNRATRKDQTRPLLNNLAGNDPAQPDAETQGRVANV